MNDEELEELVKEFGESYRNLIVDALQLVREREGAWGVKVDRRKYIAELLRHVRHGVQQ